MFAQVARSQNGARPCQGWAPFCPGPWCVLKGGVGNLVIPIIPLYSLSFPRVP